MTEHFFPRRLGLGTRILIGMVAGAGLGAALGARVVPIEPVGELFIRLLMLAALPLVFANLLAGLTALTDVGTLGRLAAKILGFYLVTTVIALCLGLATAGLLRPGQGMTTGAQLGGDVAAVPSFSDVLLDLVPSNVFRAFADGNVAQIVVVAAIVGLATLRLPEGPRDRLRQLYADLADLFRRLVDLILGVAPYGIGALMAVTVGRYGAELFGSMARFVGGVWGAQLVMVTLYLTLLRVVGWRPLPFLQRTGPLWATTAATTSSLASLSVALEVAEGLRLPRPVYSFTLPLGAQVNKDGTAILLMTVVLFTAQASGVDLGPGELASLRARGGSRREDSSSPSFSSRRWGSPWSSLRSWAASTDWSTWASRP